MFFLEIANKELKQWKEPDVKFENICTQPVGGKSYTKLCTFFKCLPQQSGHFNAHRSLNSKYFSRISPSPFSLFLLKISSLCLLISVKYVLFLHHFD